MAEGQQELAHRLQKLGLQLQLLQERAAALAQVDMVSTAGCHGLMACYVHLCWMQCTRAPRTVVASWLFICAL